MSKRDLALVQQNDIAPTVLRGGRSRVNSSSTTDPDTATENHQKVRTPSPPDTDSDPQVDSECEIFFNTSQGSQPGEHGTMDADQIKALIAQQVTEQVGDQVADQVAEYSQQMENRLLTLENDKLRLQNELLQLKNAQSVSGTDLVNAMKNIKISSITTNIPVPSFNPKKMTAEAFLNDCEKYFASVGHQRVAYIGLIKPLLSETEKGWYNHAGHLAPNWNQFRELFLARFETFIDRDMRTKELANKRQRLTEPTETFIYEVFELAKQCYPTQTTEENIRYAQKALHPRLSTILGTGFKTTPAELIQACQHATQILEQSDRTERRHDQYPPMTEAEKDARLKRKGESTNTKSSPSKDESAQGSKGHGKFQSRGRGKFRGNGRGSGSKDNTGRDRSQSHDSDSNDNEKEKPSGSDPEARSRSNTRGRKPRHANPSANQTKCYKCDGFGHIAKNCASNTGTVSCVWNEDREIYVPVMFMDKEDSDDLNEEGRK